MNFSFPFFTCWKFNEEKYFFPSKNKLSIDLGALYYLVLKSLDRCFQGKYYYKATKACSKVSNFSFWQLYPLADHFLSIFFSNFDSHCVLPLYTNNILLTCFVRNFSKRSKRYQIHQGGSIHLFTPYTSKIFLSILYVMFCNRNMKNAKIPYLLES